jgi:Tfp pilus assembly protein PilN
MDLLTISFISVVMLLVLGVALVACLFSQMDAQDEKISRLQRQTTDLNQRLYELTKGTLRRKS